MRIVFTLSRVLFLPSLSHSQADLAASARMFCDADGNMIDEHLLLLRPGQVRIACNHPVYMNANVGTCDMAQVSDKLFCV